MVQRTWRVRLTAAAELDFANIIKWTAENFGARQARIYQDLLAQTIDELTRGPDIVGAKVRDEIMQGLRSLHVARHGRRGRHALMYLVPEGELIEVVRILHDRMDLRHHIPTATDDSRK